MDKGTVGEMENITVETLMRASGVAFGTSGARGEVAAMTDLVCYGYVRGFLSYLSELGEFARGTEVAFAGDLRPSTPRILAACAKAIRDAGGLPMFCGFVPTPALALFAFGRGIPSLMVTGSHIPADRNGIKFYRPGSEVLKSDEPGMCRQSVALAPGLFTDGGQLAQGETLPAVTDVGDVYVRRYVDCFGATSLQGKRIGVYQHSAVGRDILARILRELGAEVELLGRSDTFIPVDTEAIRAEDVTIAREWAADGRFDAIVSTDGDSDRPLLADETGKWLRGDILGILCATSIGAHTVITPVSSNTALERSEAFAKCRRTRIGSPYVIAAMSEELAAGSSPVCGYEANGGFLLASACTGPTGAVLTPLPTRDAVLPILSVLASSADRVSAQVAALPQRFTYSDRIAPFPVEASRALVARLAAGSLADQRTLQGALFGSFAGEATAVDLTDGVRATFASGLIIHLRPSGNAPELRCYTEAGSETAAIAANREALAVVAATAGGQP